MNASLRSSIRRHPAWSPDGKMVAFLWDAWGKQDLFVTTPGQKPRALTNFPVDPDILTSDINSFAWISPTEILVTKGSVIYSVSATAASPKPAPFGSMSDIGNYTLSNDKKQMAFVRNGQIVIASLEGKTQHQVTNLAPMTVGGPVFSPDGQFIAFTLGSGGGGGGRNGGGGGGGAGEAIFLPFNGDRMRVVENGGGATAAAASNTPEAAPAERKVGVMSVNGGDITWTVINGKPGLDAVHRGQVAALD